MPAYFGHCRATPRGSSTMKVAHPLFLLSTDPSASRQMHKTLAPRRVLAASLFQQARHSSPFSAHQLAVSLHRQVETPTDTVPHVLGTRDIPAEEGPHPNGEHDIIEPTYTEMTSAPTQR